MMKTTARWLADYVQTGLSPEKLAEVLTLSGTEVELMEAVGADTRFTLEVTSNRTDCLSVLGLAREVAAVTGKPLKLPSPSYRTAADKASDFASVKIEPDALAACPYYTAQLIRGVKVGPSPVWLRERLEGIGLASVNNIVDITNFVLFETGQPLHAFDLSKLAGRRIVVRMARAKEKFSPIADRKQRPFLELDTSTLVIADAEKPQAVGGVMGGALSQVTESTTDILLESAYFEPRGIKAASRRLELSSDSSFRFERDVDVAQVLAASRRAAQLILEVAGGDVLDGVLEAGEASPRSREVTLDPALISRVLGIEVSPAEVRRILLALGLSASEQGMRFVAPSFRPDLERDIDLVEEVGRVYGLDRVQAPLRMTVAMARPTRRQRVRARVREVMRGLGFSEGLSDSFVNPRTSVAAFTIEGTSHTAVEARNPVNAALPALRRNLLGSLLLSLQTNQRQALAQPRIYEVANVFTPRAASRESGEHEVLGLLGRDFADVKGAVETLLARLGIEAALGLKSEPDTIFAPGRAARLSLGGEVMGVVGEPSAAVMKEFDCEGRCALAELHLGLLVRHWRETPRFTAPARFPAAERDLAVVLDASRSWAEVVACVRGACDGTLRDVELFDEFRGKQVPPGKKSLAFRLTFRHDERTLRAEEVQAQVDAAVEALSRKLGGALRA
ncbi:MAG: phenylalanine--tRNA ligase beta subunit [Planctomycetota bacterium]|nr:phenylalanine--tRNA ligase subunit beta [Planctomycetota bacterium]GIK51369.1 MAG: phenylalanine--tRNA ligase beta subunit [Planctomycetota bacterium]